MECPRCARDVNTLHGNGKYPNSTYKCDKCYDDEMGECVAGFFKAVLIVVGLVAWLYTIEQLIRS
jgi:hypothetical protein